MLSSHKKLHYKAIAAIQLMEDNKDDADMVHAAQLEYANIIELLCRPAIEKTMEDTARPIGNIKVNSLGKAVAVSMLLMALTLFGCQPVKYGCPLNVVRYKTFNK
jgi:hypothetical protein